jgi:hypothetical protein
MTDQTALSVVSQLRDLIDAAAESTGDPDLQRVARAFRQQCGGRPPEDDREALADARLSIASGIRQSVALHRAARVRYLYQTPRQLKSIVERLRRKLERETATK